MGIIIEECYAGWYITSNSTILGLVNFHKNNIIILLQQFQRHGASFHNCLQVSMWLHNNIIVQKDHQNQF